MAFNLQDIPKMLSSLWEEDYVWISALVGILLILFVLRMLRRRKNAPERNKDDWMDGFDARMEAFEKNGDPFMPVRKPLIGGGNRETLSDRTEARQAEVKPPQQEGESRTIDLNLRIHVANITIEKDLAQELTQDISSVSKEAQAEKEGGGEKEICVEKETCVENEVRAENQEAASQLENTVSVGRSGRVYSEEELRKLIRK